MGSFGTTQYLEYIISKQRPFEKLSTGINKDQNSNLGFNIRPMNWKFYAISDYGHKKCNLRTLLHIDILKRDAQGKMSVSTTHKVSQIDDKLLFNDEEKDKDIVSLKIQRGKGPAVFYVQKDSQKSECHELSCIYIDPAQQEKDWTLESYKPGSTIIEFTVSHDYESDYTDERITLIDGYYQFHTLTIVDKKITALRKVQPIPSSLRTESHGSLK